MKNEKVFVFYPIFAGITGDFKDKIMKEEEILKKFTIEEVEPLCFLQASCFQPPISFAFDEEIEALERHKCELKEEYDFLVKEVDRKNKMDFLWKDILNLKTEINNMKTKLMDSNASETPTPKT